MYWPKFSMKKFHRLIAKDSPNGSSCTYIRWTKYVGLKTYTRQGERDQSANLQKRAADRGLAPKVGKSFEFQVVTCNVYYSAPKFSRKTIYCYWTEHADDAQSITKTEDLEEGLSDIGIRHDDLYTKNLGRIRGKLVCIDFDPASCADMVA